MPESEFEPRCPLQLRKSPTTTKKALGLFACAERDLLRFPILLEQNGPLRRGEGKPAEGFLRTLSLADSGSAPIVPASRAGTLW